MNQLFQEVIKKNYLAVVVILLIGMRAAQASWFSETYTIRFTNFNVDSSNAIFVYLDAQTISSPCTETQDDAVYMIRRNSLDPSEIQAIWDTLLAAKLAARPIKLSVTGNCVSLYGKSYETFDRIRLY